MCSPLTRSREARGTCLEDGLCAIHDLDFGEHTREVVPSGLRGEAEPVGDLNGGGSGGEQVENLPFAIG